MVTTAERLRREGRIEGKREMLVGQLQHRFGALPAAAIARIDEAGVTDLHAWALRILSASSLDEVLAAKAWRKTLVSRSSGGPSSDPVPQITRDVERLRIAKARSRDRR